MTHEQWSQELRLSGSTENMDWVVGLYAFEEDGEATIDVPLFRGVTLRLCSLLRWQPLPYKLNY